MVYLIEVEPSLYDNHTAHQLFETNKDILTKHLNSFYVEHPEIDFIDAKFRYVPINSRFLDIYLTTQFYTAIVNQQNKRKKIKVEWSTEISQRYHINNIHKKFELKNTEPSVVCLENMWYNGTSESVFELAQKYNHPNVLIDSLIQENNNLKNSYANLNDIYDDIYDKYNTISEDNKKYRNLFYILLAVTIGLALRPYSKQIMNHINSFF